MERSGSEILDGEAFGARVRLVGDVSGDTGSSGIVDSSWINGRPAKASGAEILLIRLPKVL